MKQEVPNFLRLENDTLYFNQPGTFIFYVPEKFFNNGCAEVIGETVKTIGILNYEILNTNGKSIMFERFFFPTRFDCTPSYISKAKDIQVGNEKGDFRKLVFEKGAKVVNSIEVVETITNVEDIFQMMVVTGNIPPNLSYDILQDYFTEPMELNNGDYKVNMQMFGIIISELCRDSKDLSKPFRYNKDKLSNPYDYTSISVIESPKLTSPYSSITSYYYDDAVIAAIMNTNTVDNPLEKLLT